MSIKNKLYPLKGTIVCERSTADEILVTSDRETWQRAMDVLGDLPKTDTNQIATYFTIRVPVSSTPGDTGIKGALGTLAAEVTCSDLGTKQVGIFDEKSTAALRDALGSGQQHYM